MTPILSLLIPCVPSRHALACSLFNSLQSQALPYDDIEILMLLDNKMRSTGHKRQALVDIAQGDYVAFIEDDDEVLPGYLAAVRLGCLERPDVVYFNSICTIEQHERVPISHGPDNPNEQFNPAGFQRNLWPLHAWKREYTVDCKFPDNSQTEDWPWIEQVVYTATMRFSFPIRLLQAVKVGSGPLYHYRRMPGVPSESHA